MTTASKLDVGLSHKDPKTTSSTDGKSMSKEDNPKDDTEVRLVAKTKFKAIIGMLSYIAGQNVLSKFCNNPGRRHIIFLNHLVKYCEYSKNDRL